jgi:hypothetical protein
LIAVAIALPNVLWQAHHAFPMIELLQNGQQRKNVVLDPFSFALQQLEITNPILALVWIAGLIWAFLTPAARWIGIAFVALLVLMIALHAKSYYLCDAYPALFALGAVSIERWTSRARFLRPAAIVLAAVAGFVLIPLVLPILPVQQFIVYNAALSKVLPLGSLATEHHTQSVLPQTYADMHGWPQLAQVVAGVYDGLPSAERSQAVIVVQNYGEAAAIQFFTEPELPVVSGHNQYFLWGTRGYSGNVLLDVNGDCGHDRHLFRSAQKAATFTARYVMPYEDDMPIMLCRGIKQPLAQIWPSIKNYI